jgi:flagellar biosynthetic protein FliR
VVGFPFKMLFGIVVLFLVIPGFFAVLLWLFQHMFEAMSQVMQWLGI